MCVLGTSADFAPEDPAASQGGDVTNVTKWERKK